VLLCRSEAFGNIVFHPEDDQFWAEVRSGETVAQIYNPLTITCRLDGCPRVRDPAGWPPLMDMKRWRSNLDRVQEAGILRVNFDGIESVPRGDVFDIVRVACDRGLGVVVSARDCTPDLDRYLGLPSGVTLQVHFNPGRAWREERSSGLSLARRFEILHQCRAARKRVRVLTVYDRFSPLSLAEIAEELAQANVYEWLIFPPELMGERKSRLPRAVLDEIDWISEMIPTLEVDEGRPGRESSLMVYPDGKVLAVESIQEWKVVRGTVDDLVAGRLLSPAFLGQHVKYWVKGVLEAAEEYNSASEAEDEVETALSSRYVFLGYSRRDRSFASSLRDELEAARISAWLDTRNIEAGAHWQEEIQKALEGAWASLICIGPSGLGGFQRYEVAMALDLASREKLRIIPVILPGVEESKIPLWLRQFQYIDFRQGKAEALLRLIQALRRQGSPPPIPAQEHPAPG
jgi:hypothetical protein